MNRTVGLVGGEDVIGVLLVDAVTGEISEYNLENVPEWVDRVFTATLLRTQFDWYGRYGNGFWNSLLAQRGVWQATPGYNYLIQRNDVYMYSGVSAAGGAVESIIGFVLVNQRTRETHFYQIAGAAETFAQNAAQGAVQAHGWRATHPLLINVSGHATYFMALKDNNNNVQGFAMTNVEQFNLINVWAQTTDANVVVQLYLDRLAELNLDVDSNVYPGYATNVNPGTIASIRQVAIDGTTNLLIRLQGNSAYYRMVVSNSNLYLALLNVGDEVTVYSPINWQPADENDNIIPASRIRQGAAAIDSAQADDDVQPEE
jgi:hypothetical protein